MTLTCGSWSEGQHDLYFTVQWFCLISWRLFHVCTSYFGIMNQYDPTFDLKINCRSLWPIFRGPLILCYILETIWCMNIIIWDYESVWPDVGPQNNCRSLWRIFHGPVILPYILKTIWCIYIILCSTVTADILTKVLQKCSLSSPLPIIWILSKPLNLIGCHDNRNTKFAKIY